MNDPKKFNLFEFHKMFEEDILILYKGPFTKHILSVFNKYIEGIIRKHPLVSKKVFSIFIELAQNITYYSAEVDLIEKDEDDREAGIGTLAIGELTESYTFFTGNKINNNDIVPLIEKCELINSLSHDELRKYRREQLNRPQGSHGSAHIGLIQVALTSGNQLDIEVNPIDETYSFFSITVHVKKTL